jgi:hypothetical protein
VSILLGPEGIFSRPAPLIKIKQAFKYAATDSSFEQV